jgi:probable F420-dependent oxidoreductase
VRFGLQLRADDPKEVAVEARRAEELGFDTVLVADHVGSDWSPLLCLGAAAAATTTVRLGTFVLNAGLHHPLLLARDVATLDHLSGGRVELGLGAGHTPAEFAAAGVPFASARVRKARLAEFVEIIRDLVDGKTVDHRSEHFVLASASTERAAQNRLPILVGGSGAALLTHAARHADIVGFTGLGRTLPDGHRHAARFQPAVLDAEVELVRRVAGARPVELNVLVQSVQVTDDRVAAAAALAERIEDLTVEDALATPFLALGTHDEIAEHFRLAHERWSISYFVVREPEAFAPVITRLRTTSR